MHKAFTYTMLLDAIRTSPQSWRAMALRYYGASDPDTPANSSEELHITGNLGDTVIISPAPLSSREGSGLIFQTQDIAAHWQLVVGMLEGIMNMEAAKPVETVSLPPSKLHPTFLIVEDDSMTSKLLSQHLEKYGKVLTTRNAREATANFNVYRPDLVFLDIHYQEDIYDGFDVLNNILNADPGKPVVMFSADHNPATILRALSSGAKGFITKPFKADSLACYINRFIDAA